MDGKKIEKKKFDRKKIKRKIESKKTQKGVKANKSDKTKTNDLRNPPNKSIFEYAQHILAFVGLMCIR